jgi:transcriptional regulator with XRE-family HTH domain
MEPLKTYLERKEISQAQFAQLVGVTQPTVSDWINGRMLPSTDRLVEISRVTGLSIDKLLDNPARKRAS